MKNLKEAKLGKAVFSRISEDEDLLEAITQRAKQTKISSGILFLIGSLKKATLGFYSKGKYHPIKLNEPLEIVSCIGNISTKNEGELVVHAHMVVSNREGEAYGGHVLSGCIVATTAELIMLDATEAKLQRKFDEKTKLYLWFLTEQDFRCGKK